MQKADQQTALASGEANVPDENQPQTRLPRENERHYESDKDQAFIDEKQLLARLPVSRRTLFNWRVSGKIPHVKIGRRNLFHWPSIEDALLRKQKGGAQ